MKCKFCETWLPGAKTRCFPCKVRRNTAYGMQYKKIKHLKKERPKQIIISRFRKEYAKQEPQRFYPNVFNPNYIIDLWL